MEFEILRDIIAGVLRIDGKDIRPDSDFSADLYADSLEIFRIVIETENRFSCNLAARMNGLPDSVDEVLELL